MKRSTGHHAHPLPELPRMMESAKGSNQPLVTDRTVKVSLVMGRGTR